VADFLSGVLDATVVATVGDGELRLIDGQKEGRYTSAEHVLPFPSRAAGVLFRARVPEGASVSFAVRARGVSGEWSEWIAIAPGPWMDPEGRTAGEPLALFPAESDVLQYRITFLAGEGGGPAVEEVVLVYLAFDEGPLPQGRPPWEEPDGQPRPVPVTDWGGEVSSPQGVVGTSAVTRVEIRPAALATGAAPTAPALRTIQRFQREALGFAQLAYGYLVDAQGIVYQGGDILGGDVLHIGVVGGTPSEPFPPSAEDALVALLEAWQEDRPPEAGPWHLETPGDPALGERIVARLEAHALRQNRWWFVRGATASQEHEWLLLSNVGPRRTAATWELFPDQGAPRRGVVSVAARSRASLFVNRLLPEGRFWAKVSPASSLIVERALYYGPDSDASAGLDVLSQEWYLPGGSQEAGFTTTLWLLNPQPVDLPITVTVFAPNGVALEKAFQAPAGERLELPLHRVYTERTVVGCRVRAGAPIVAEQEVRFGTGGYGMPGTPILSRSWTIPGVETEAPFWTILAFLNPREDPVGITLTLMTTDGTSLRRLLTIQPGEQRLNLNTILPRLSLAAQVSATYPIAVARVTFFNELRAAHATLGAPRPARRWYLAEGSTAEPFEALLQVVNPNREPAELTVTLLGTQGERSSDRFRMPARSRLTIPLNELLPSTAALATVVEANEPIVVERAMYLHGREGGHASLGIPR